MQWWHWLRCEYCPSNNHSSTLGDILGGILTFREPAISATTTTVRTWSFKEHKWLLLLHCQHLHPVDIQTVPSLTLKPKKLFAVPHWHRSVAIFYLVLFSISANYFTAWATTWMTNTLSMNVLIYKCGISQKKKKKKICSMTAASLCEWKLENNDKVQFRLLIFHNQD